MAKFQPKGGMCRTCEMVEHDCSGMKFDEMPVIESESGGSKIVKCINYVRRRFCVCGKQWDDDMDLFGCWSCGAEAPAKHGGQQNASTD